MRWFRAEADTEEETWELFHALDKAGDRLREAGMDNTPARVADVLNAQGHNVEVVKDSDGTNIVRKKGR
jgi:hypothetical protein